MGFFSSLSFYMYICHIHCALLRHTYPPDFVVLHLPSAAGPCSGLWPMKELFMHCGEKTALLQWCRFSFLLVIWAIGGFCHQVQVKLTCLSASTVRGSLFLLRPTLTVTKPRSVCAEVGDKSHVLSVGIRNTRYVFHCIHVFQYQKGSPFEISLLGGMWTTGLEKWSLVFQRVTRSLHQVHVPLAMGSDQWIIFGLILSIIFSWRCNCEKLHGVTTLASNSVSQRSSKAF